MQRHCRHPSGTAVVQRHCRTCSGPAGHGRPHCPSMPSATQMSRRLWQSQGQALDTSLGTVHPEAVGPALICHSFSSVQRHGCPRLPAAPALGCSLRRPALRLPLPPRGLQMQPLQVQYSPGRRTVQEAVGLRKHAFKHVTIESGTPLKHRTVRCIRSSMMQNDSMIRKERVSHLE